MVVDEILARRSDTERIEVREAAAHGVEGLLGDFGCENIVANFTTTEYVVPDSVRHLLWLNV